MTTSTRVGSCPQCTSLLSFTALRQRAARGQERVLADGRYGAAQYQAEFDGGAIVPLWRGAHHLWCHASFARPVGSVLQTAPAAARASRSRVPEVHIASIKAVSMRSLSTAVLRLSVPYLPPPFAPAWIASSA